MTSLTDDEIKVSTESLQGCGIHLVPVTRIRIKVGMLFCKSLKRLVGTAGWTHCRTEVTEENFREEGLCQVDEAMLRMAFGLLQP